MTKSKKEHLAELKDHIGKKASWIVVSGVEVIVRIVDVKISYGVPRFKIEPLTGAGQVWITKNFTVIPV